MKNFTYDLQVTKKVLWFPQSLKLNFCPLWLYLNLFVLWQVELTGSGAHSLGTKNLKGTTAFEIGWPW